MTKKLVGLARRLVSEKLIDDNQISLAIDTAQKKAISLVSHLVRTKLIDETAIAVNVADEFSLPLLALDSFDIDRCPEKIITPALLKRHRALPLSIRGNRLYLAFSDPGNLSAINELAFHCGMNIEVIIVEEGKLNSAIQKFLLRIDRSYTSSEGRNDADIGNIEIEPQTKIDSDEELNALDETPLVRFINKLLLEAINMRASDIHFEPYESIYRVRFRIDGVLREMTKPPVKLTSRLAARLKIMSQLDISEKRLPQDGRIQIHLRKDRIIDLRVNTLPTLWGEKIVLRILDPFRTKLSVDTLGMEIHQKEQFSQALHRAQGLILVTGPTGSGKTLSLYTGINELNKPSRNISTVEDPIEITLEGVNQIAVNNKSGLSFASTLRALLRQDPDVIMLGEIRDLETAEIALRAAQTGHLVLTTLHTLSAASSLSRLRSMGIPAYNLANTITLVVAQRLARRLCDNCKESVQLPEKILIEQGFLPAQLAELSLFQPKGCDQCRDGYNGRIGFYEVVPVSEALSRIIMEHDDSLGIEDYAKQAGFLSLRDSVLLKVGRGLTSLDEANRLT